LVLQEPVLGLLIRLDKVAAEAAPGRQAVGDAVTLEVKLCADLVALENVHEDRDTAASQETETKAGSVDG